MCVCIILCFILLEPVAFISNGIQLPPLAVYNRIRPASINLICASTNGNRELKIKSDHEDLPMPLIAGLYYTTNGAKISIIALENAIVINMTNLLENVEISCISQQSGANAEFIRTTGIANYILYKVVKCLSSYVVKTKLM